jgi:hypothetical protein
MNRYQDERRRIELVRRYQITEDELSQIIAYNRRVLRTFTRSRIRCSTPPFMAAATWSDRFVTLFQEVCYAVRNHRASFRSRD